MNKPVSTVKVVGYTNCGEAICAASGRISTLSGDTMEILEKSREPQKNAALIEKVTASGHTSTIEHINFNLAFTNVSVLVEQFMIEFRLASFTVKSRRYVDFSDAGFYIPDFSDNDERDAFTAAMAARFADYSALIEHGILKEDARFVLPYCFYSNFFCTLNGRELYHVLDAMLFGRGAGYPEIKRLGEQILEEVKAIAPGVFSRFMEHARTIEDSVLPGFIIPECVPTTPENEQKTELLAYTPQPERVVAQTALIEGTRCPTAQIDAILEDKAAVAGILDHVMRSERPRALENVTFTFRFNGLSLAGITHLVRHRMQSVMIPPLSSGSPDQYIIPDSVKANPVALEIYQKAFQEAAVYHRSAPENIKAYALLSGNTLDPVVTMNARELLLFLRLRTCNRAQWEIRAYAVEMLLTLRNLAPALFAHFGPSCCVMDHCPEGRLSCGKMQEVREQFKAR